MAQAMAEFTLDAIGTFHGSHKHKSSLPRQGNLSQQKGFIEFEKGYAVNLALRGLEKMSHVWILFIFHEALSKARNRPLVRPPRNPDIQVGVWATRSPHRPNSLGLTLAKIERIEKQKLYLSQVDLLDGTPILDLKPYVTESDSPQKTKQQLKLGWIDEVESWKYKLAPKAFAQAAWLKENGLEEVEDVFESQFGTPPLQPKRKRIKAQGRFYILSYRTWRFLFKLNKTKKLSEILEISSGYTSEELMDPSNRYQDKDLHRSFLRQKFTGLSVEK